MKKKITLLILMIFLIINSFGKKELKTEANEKI